MDNLLSSISQNHWFWPKIDYLFIICHRQVISISKVNLPLFNFILNFDCKTSFLNFCKNISILHELNMNSFMHGIENLALFLLITVKLAYVPQQIISDKVQKVADHW